MTTKIAENKQAAFTTGSTMRHVIVMTSTASVGLVSIFFVDLLNLFYISWLGDQALTAAIGYASTVMFFSLSICIGLMIATSALVGRAIGKGEADRAKILATSSLVFTGIFTTVFAISVYPFLPWFLSTLGARGETFDHALGFMRIVVPSIPFMGLGMCFGGLLRAKGDAKRSMFVTLSGGVTALVLDPIFIFGFDLGITGAAITVFIVRIVLVVIGYWGAQGVHKMLGRYDRPAALRQMRPFFTIAIPAIITQLATPFGNAYVTQAIAEFGDSAVAGWAIIGRILPVAFGTLFALSGAVGPILSQNFGAALFSRVNQTLKDAMVFTMIYGLVVWALLALFSPWIVSMFSATSEAASLVQLFCTLVAGSFLFNGALFVANASFNNLGFPLYATFFNWGRATLGVIPFVMIGKAYGAEGVLMGWGLGAVIFGVSGAITAFYVTKKLGNNVQT
ncbi:MAG: MATE family efflux transporter [Rhizobiaceae bacterium]